PLTSVNLMSPWYTGTRTGLRVSNDGTQHYVADQPDVIPTFAVSCFHPERVLIRVRDHRTRRWLKEWRVPLL
ncbi:MAG TPA: hypothetical protein VGT82_13375, partial [Ktedonobacteraceae bacterium]|nr:hypothetical protein [Ktedonobacteraceae bacterium]